MNLIQALQEAHSLNRSFILFEDGTKLLLAPKADYSQLTLSDLVSDKWRVAECEESSDRANLSSEEWERLPETLGSIFDRLEALEKHNYHPKLGY